MQTTKIFKLLLINMGHFLILELGDYDYRGIAAVVNSIPTVLPSAMSPLPRIARQSRRPHYRAAHYHVPFAITEFVGI